MTPVSSTHVTGTTDPPDPPPLATGRRKGLRGLAKAGYWYGDSMRRYVANEKFAGVRLSAGERLYWLARGFHGYSVAVYGLTQSNWRDYVPDFGRYQLIQLNSRAPSVLNDKLLFERAFSHHVRVPRVVAMIRGGKVSSQLAGSEIGKVMSLAGMLDTCPEGIAIKPVRGGGGFGVHIVTRDTDGIRLDGKQVDTETVERMMARMVSSLVVARVVQHGFSARIFPHTTNSIRIMTLLDRASQRAFVAGAVWRFGVAQSIPVDNWSSGGICALIDLSNGVLGEAIGFRPEGPPYLSRMERHPDSGVRIAGEKVPLWEEIIGRVKHTAEMFPMYPVLGWDVVVTADGFQVLEINSAPGVGIHQYHEPLMRNPQVRKFMHESGALMSPFGHRA